jgi:hypothetical protein
MLKNILNLNGTQELSRNEQKSINGAGPQCKYLSNGIVICYKKCPWGGYIESTENCFQ